MYLFSGHNKDVRQQERLALYGNEQRALDQSIQSYRGRIDNCPKDDVAYPLLLCDLAVELSNRYELIGKIEDLNQAISKQRQALHRLKSHPNHPQHEFLSCIVLNNIAADYFRRYQVHDDDNDRKLAMNYAKKVSRFSSVSELSKFRSCHTRALTSYLYFERHGDHHNLKLSVELHHLALQAVSEEQVSTRGYALNSLANTLWALPDKMTSGTHRVEEAIGRHREAYCSQCTRHQLDFLNNLGVGLYDAGSIQGETPGLSEAISHFETLLSNRPPGHPGRFLSLNNLGSALLARYIGQQPSSIPRKCHDLDIAENLLVEADAICPIRHPDRPVLLCNLALCLFEISRLDPASPRSRKALTNTFRCYEAAVKHSTNATLAHFNAAFRWAVTARRCRHFTILEASSHVFHLRETLVFSIKPDIQAQFDYLAALPASVASDAAADAISRNNVPYAVMLLEQGRAILWSRLLSFSDEYKINQEDTTSIAESDTGTFISYTTQRAQPTPRRHRITAFDDPRRFFPVPYSSLQPAADYGPVVIVNISERRSDAIIMHNTGSRAPQIVPLPNATPIAIAEIASQLSHLQSLNAMPKRRAALMRNILRDLWNLVVSLVVKQLMVLKIQKESRIWWCPTSHLCALPLHAAGLYYGSFKQERLPNLYMSSYTPSLSALIRARSVAGRQTSVVRLLLIGQETISLPRVQTELRNIAHAACGQLTELYGKRANRCDVLDQLSKHNWVHFACHGQLNEKPFLSSFQLRDDEIITLQELVISERYEREFAFLSACHTAAVGHRGAPDEVINLAAALQFSGFRSVIGTLWAMGDYEAPGMAESFYEGMFVNGLQSARAENSASVLFRTLTAMSKDLPLDRWASFVHIGA